MYISIWLMGIKAYYFLVSECSSPEQARKLAQGWLGTNPEADTMTEIGTNPVSERSLYWFCKELNKAWITARFETESRISSEYTVKTKGRGEVIVHVPKPQREAETVRYIVL